MPVSTWWGPASQFLQRWMAATQDGPAHCGLGWKWLFQLTANNSGKETRPGPEAAEKPAASWASCTGSRGRGGPRGGGAGSVQRRKRSRGTTAEMEPGHLGPPCCRSACPHGGGQQTRGDSDVSAARSSLQKVTFRLLQNRTEFKKTPLMVDRICTNSERKVVLTAMLEQPDVYVGRDEPDAHFG